MTSMHYRDRDLHTRNGDHARRAPQGCPDPEAWHRRLRQHLLAHDLTADAPLPTPPRADKARPTSKREIDPWLADMNEKIATVLGPKVRLLLKEHGVPQQQLADDLGMHLSTLADRLAGRKVFELGEALFLEEFFGIPIEELLNA